MKVVSLKYLLMITFFSLSFSLLASERDLLLIGGGLKFCSSYSTKNCLKTINYSDDAYTTTYYRVLPERIALIKADHFKSFGTVEVASNIVALLNKYTLRFNQAKVTRSELLSRLDNLKLTDTQILGRKILDSLSPKEWNFVFHTLTDPVTDALGKPLTEFVNLENSDPHSVEIIQHFVDLVKNKSPSKKPLVLVSTASANNPFDAVSFYIQLFGHFEVDVAWLPLDANLNQILNEKDLSCTDLDNNRSKAFSQFNRETIYPFLTKYQKRFCENPQYIEQLINRADGLFFNGGDQYLTLKAFSNTNIKPNKFSEYYLSLKRRFNLGQIVVAGTSAGSAVQSGGEINGQIIPMVTNGPSIDGLFNGSVYTNQPPSKQCSFDKSCEQGTSLDSLTYFKNGGFDLLPIGLVDTHFSQRNRLFRLIRLLADTQLSTGFGIDENTALHIRQVNGERLYNAIGEAGVWKVKTSKHLMVPNTKPQALNSSSKFLISVMHQGDSASIEKLGWLGDDIIAKMLTRAASAQSLKSIEKVSYKERSAKVNLELKDEKLRFQLEVLMDID